LKKRKEEFIKLIDDIYNKIDDIPNSYESAYIKDEAVGKMQEFRENLNIYLNEMSDINKEETQLDW
jgi:hypothetical protein